MWFSMKTFTGPLVKWISLKYKRIAVKMTDFLVGIIYTRRNEVFYLRIERMQHVCVCVCVQGYALEDSVSHGPCSG